MWPTRVEVWRLSGHLLPESKVLRLGIGPAGGWSSRECFAVAPNAKRTLTILRSIYLFSRCVFYPLPARKFFDGPLQHIGNQIGFGDVLRDAIPRKAVSQPWSSEHNGTISKIIGNSVQICFLSRFHSTFEVPPLYQNMLTQTSAPDGSTLGTHWLSIAPSCHSHRKCGEHQLLQ